MAERASLAAQITRLPVDAVVVATDGSSGSIERARTSLERAFPFEGTPVAVVALDPSTARLLAAIQDMTAVIIVASLIIAACSLAVNVMAGLGERKRPFSLLRLAGLPLGILASCDYVGKRAAAFRRCRGFARRRSGCGSPLPQLSSRHIVRSSRDYLLGSSVRRSRGFTSDSRLDLSAAEPDHGTRGRTERVNAVNRSREPRRPRK